MRSCSLVLILSLVCLANALPQSAEDITSITFTKQNRGFLDEVIISRDSVQGFLENHRVPDSSRQYATGFDQDGWTKIMMALRDVSLADIDGLQSPTMNRAHDSAIHSTLVIAFADGSSVTHSFDDENPHPDLRPLLDVILEYRTPAGR